MTDHIEILRRYNIWRRGTDESVPMIAPEVIGVAIDATIAEVDRLRLIEAAARNLIAQKGRHNTEIAYQRLVEVCKC